MKALRWYSKGDLRYENAPEPSPGPGQVKVRVHFTGICGSDLHEYQTGPILIDPEAAPLILGHEYSGRVAEVGQGVSSVKPGDRVAGDCVAFCGKCFYCMRNMSNLCLKPHYIGFSTNGSMAEYIVVPESIVYKLPDSISDEIGALVEPLEVGFHAVRQSRLQIGDTIAILGAGTIGTCTLLAAKASGAAKILVVEISKARGERALGNGATAIINPNEVDPVEQIRKLTGGLGVDISFECIGLPFAGPLAVTFARKAGTVVIVGMATGPSPDFNFFDIWLTEKYIVGSSGYVRGDASTITELLTSGKIDPSRLITGKVALEDAIEKGFKELDNNPEKNLKILLES